MSHHAVKVTVLVYLSVIMRSELVNLKFNLKFPHSIQDLNRTEVSHWQTPVSFESEPLILDRGVLFSLCRSDLPTRTMPTRPTGHWHNCAA